MSQFPYAAVATKRRMKFVGGEPSVGLPLDAKCEQKVCLAPPDDDFAPGFMSCKISAMRDSLLSIKECLLRSPLSKYYSFSVNDCQRKIHAKNEKRRNRRNKQLIKEMMCSA